MSSPSHWAEWLIRATSLRKKYAEQEKKVLEALQEAQGQEAFVLLSILHNTLQQELLLYKRFERGPQLFLQRFFSLENIDHELVRLASKAEQALIADEKGHVQALLTLITPLSRTINQHQTSFRDAKSLFSQRLSRRKIRHLAKKFPEDDKVEEVRRQVLTYKKPRAEELTEQEIVSWRHQAAKLLHQESTRKLLNLLKRAGWQLNKVFLPRKKRELLLELQGTVLVASLILLAVPAEDLGLDLSLLEGLLSDGRMIFRALTN